MKSVEAIEKKYLLFNIDAHKCEQDGDYLWSKMHTYHERELFEA